MTQEDIVKRYYSGRQDSERKQHEYEGNATSAVSGRLARTALASILAANSDACTPEASGPELRNRLEERGPGLAEAPPPPRQSIKVAIKANGRIVFIDPDDVIAIEAEGNYVLLQRRSDSYLLRESISVMAEILKPYGFVRIHRSVLVNSSFVEHIQSLPTGGYGLHVASGKEYTVTRTYKNNLKSLAAAWIATDILFDE